ncbi:MAG: hypothetical protein KME05_02445 [Gloeocapsa sp. UFS-A4-WI-NPMV-4B04]|jgi:hypothetical protein|nr:hypothetical protein [Gloeocapsa sp. UFS-A4-WI-NPMV-4B04]
MEITGSMLLSSIEHRTTTDPVWQQMCQRLQAATSLTHLVLAAWQIGLWLARAIVEQQLDERSQVPTQWTHCSVCCTALHSKGFVKRRMLTLVGEIEWKRRIGRCPHHCSGSHQTPLDEILGIQAYQQTSLELVRLGCLLAVFLPFDLASQLLLQLTGIAVSGDTIWN